MGEIYWGGADDEWLTACAGAPVAGPLGLVVVWFRATLWVAGAEDWHQHLKRCGKRR